MMNTAEKRRARKIADDRLAMTSPRPNIVIEPQKAPNYIPHTVYIDGMIVQTSIPRYDAISLKQQLIQRWREGKRVWPIRNPETGEVD